MRVGLFCVAILCSAHPAVAQSVPHLPRWDVAGTVGWLAGDKSDLAEEWNEWYDTFAASVDVGRYWTSHLKSEAGVLFTTEGSVYSQIEVPIPRQPFRVFVPREHHFRLSAVNVGLAYQFLDNQWVHPFVNAGVQLGWEHERRFAPEQVFPGVDPRSPVVAPLIDRDEGSDFAARPYASGGAKFYVNERGFVRTDLTLAWHKGGIGQVAWRAGFGVDF